MARVVQRRSNPPYLLIAFVFLFLIAAALATIFYFQGQEKDAKIVKADAGMAKLATPEQAQKSETVEGTTVLGNLNNQIGNLTQDIAGIACSYKDAQDKVEDITKLLGSRRGLVAELKDLKTERDNLKAQAATLQGDLKKSQDAVEAAITAQKAQQTAYESSTEELKNQVDAEGKKGTAREAAHAAELKKVNDANQKAVADLTAQLKKASDQAQDLQKQNELLDQKIAIMVADFRKENTPKANIEKLIPLAKGKVSEVNDDLVYIDKGSNDRIVPGLTFAVYPPSGIPDNEKDQKEKMKGTIIVTNVSKFSSECRIKSEGKISNPILSGDVIGNLAYDPQRTYTFVVIGDFDLQGNGTPQGTKEVKDMIVRSGGKVADTISIHTDFLVVGDVPVVIKAEGEEGGATAAPSKVQQELDRAKRDAAKWFIPVLDSNRFLALMGYTPEKGR